MKSTSELIAKYNIGKNQFYQRRGYLLELGYKIQGRKNGRSVVYTDEQIAIFDRLDKYIQEQGTMSGFPTADFDREQKQLASSTDNGNGSGAVSNLEEIQLTHEHIEAVEAAIQTSSELWDFQQLEEHKYSQAIIDENEIIQNEEIPVTTELKEEKKAETESEKDSHSFSFILTGTIEPIEDTNYFVCPDGTKLRLKKIPEEMSEISGKWEVIPSTDSSGKITTVTILAAANSELEDGCHVSGRVIQLGKRSPLVLIKIDRLGQKTLKVSLLQPDPRMKTGQEWNIVATRIGDMLIIDRASPFNTDEWLSTATRETKAEAPNTKVLPDITAPTSSAIAVLEEHGLQNWKLGTPKFRNYYWEWECYDPLSQEKATVHVSKTFSRVYKYGSSATQEADPDIDHLVITPLGAARDIGASCFKIEIGPYEVVLDCGTRPKGFDPLPELDYLSNPNLLLVSHSHQDHLGAVPVFHSRYPSARMICTHGTREIAHVMLTDGLKLQHLNEDSPELFNSDDLDRTLFRLETFPLGVDFEPLPGLTVRFINAGHILGAACVYMRYGPRTLLYTGDFHTTNSRTTTGLKLADLPKADILITETTYGSDTHESRKAQETALLDSVARVVRAGGNVLIPAFALGRAQEILLALRMSPTFVKLNVPVYVDGLVRQVTEVFRDNLELLPDSVQNFVRQNCQEQMFDEAGSPPIIAIQHKKERPLAMAKPSIIISSSGMLIGGPSVYYAGVLLERENAAIFISGYTDEESPGRLLQNLQTGDTIELDGRQITVKAQVKRFNLSAHADRIGLGQVINKVNPSTLVLVHGCGDALHEIARAGDNKSKYYIYIPRVGERIEHGVAPEHLSETQIALLEQPQEFVVTTEVVDDEVYLRIPEDVVENDPRWSALTATGMMRAKWDGLHLKLSSVTQEFLALEAAIKKAKASGVDCCAVCDFFERGKCSCPASVLFDWKVDPSGVCGEFERQNNSE